MKRCKRSTESSRRPRLSALSGSVMVWGLLTTERQAELGGRLGTLAYGTVGLPESSPALGQVFLASPGARPVLWHSVLTSP